MLRKVSSLRCFICSDTYSFTRLKSQLAFVKANGDTLGFAVWSAGSFDTDYTLSVVPNSDGTDQQLWTDAGKFVSTVFSSNVLTSVPVVPNLP